MYSLYCVYQCPIGKPASDKFLARNNSAYDAAIDMQEFVRKCMENGCSYEKERLCYGERKNE